MFTHEEIKELPSIGEYDIVVVGGGIAGIGAACAASYSGAKTILVERLEMLGGLGSAGCVANFCAAEGGFNGQGRVFDNIINILRAQHAIGEENGWPIRHDAVLKRENWTFDYRFLPLVLQQIVLDAGVDLLYATDVIGAECKDRRIMKVVVTSKSLWQSISARVFIDASGDGILSRHAGGHALPDDPQFSGVIKPSNMIFMRKSSNATRSFIEDEQYIDKVEPSYSIWPDTVDRVALKMRLFHRDLDTSTTRGYSDAIIAMRQETLRFAEHFRQYHDSAFVYDGAAPMLGIRESSRIKGDYMLTADDCRAGKRFDDAVAYGTFTIDANETSEILPPYQIPLRSLLVKDVKNCLVVGRCFSADRLALSSARTMPTACLMGQAAGIAASLASNTELRAIDATIIRHKLIKSSGDNQTMIDRLETGK